jgi:hypothetical protein
LAGSRVGQVAISGLSVLRILYVSNVMQANMHTPVFNGYIPTFRCWRPLLRSLNKFRCLYSKSYYIHYYDLTDDCNPAPLFSETVGAAKRLKWERQNCSDLFSLNSSQASNSLPEEIRKITCSYWRFCLNVMTSTERLKCWGPSPLNSCQASDRLPKEIREITCSYWRVCLNVMTLRNA